MKNVFVWVEFLRDWTGHLRGSQAEMRDWLASDLVTSGIAVRIIKTDLLQ